VVGAAGRRLLLAVAGASLVLSMAAVYLDPVVDPAGAGELQAARWINAGEWHASLAVSERPAYALLTAWVSLVPGLDVTDAARVIQAVFHAMLAAGFVAFAGALGSGRALGLIAALLVLLYPALIELRSSVAGEAAYWAMHVWSLALLVRFVDGGDAAWFLRRWVPVAAAAAAFSLQGLVWLALVPAWMGLRGRGRSAGLLFAVLAASAITLYVLWMHSGPLPAADSGFRLDQWLSGSWSRLTQEVGFRAEALRARFVDEFSAGYAGPALVASLVTLMAAGLLETLGWLYGVLAVYAVLASRSLLSTGRRRAWRLVVCLDGALLAAPAVAVLMVSERDALPLSLAILALVPGALERLWRSAGNLRWAAALAGALALGAGAVALVPETDRFHLREAGQWLASRAAPGDSLYTNNRVVEFYAGTGPGRQDAEYSWQAAMRTVWRGRWREYDFLALEIPAGSSHRLGTLKQWLELEPDAVFAGANGDRVLVFRAPDAPGRDDA